MNEVRARFRQRTNESDVWFNINPTLLAGEIGIESDTGKFKYGDGRRSWRQLDYAYGSGLQSIICETENQLKTTYSADKHPGAIAILPQTYNIPAEKDEEGNTIAEAYTMVLDTPYISLRKNGRWQWIVFSDSKDKPIVSSTIGAFVIGVSPLG